MYPRYVPSLLARRVDVRMHDDVTSLSLHSDLRSQIEEALMERACMQKKKTLRKQVMPLSEITKVLWMVAGAEVENLTFTNNET